MQQDNGFDDLGAQPEWPEDQKASFERLDYLIHQVFAETESGVELLKVWKRTLVYQPTAMPGTDLLEIGMAEGVKSFIRNIIVTIEKVENE